MTITPDLLPFLIVGLALGFVAGLFVIDRVVFIATGKHII